MRGARVGVVLGLGALACSRNDHTPLPAPLVIDAAAPASSSSPIPVVDAATTAPETCEPFVTAGENARTKALGGKAPCKDEADVPRDLKSCAHGANGAFVGLRVAQIAIDKCIERARVELVHVDANGNEVARVLGPTATRGSLTFDFDGTTGWGWSSLGPPVYFDYDGDGDPEVLVAGVPPGAHADEWRGREWHEALTFKNGAWTTYAPLANVHVVKTFDADHDGRPDVLTRGPYESLLAIRGLAGSTERIFPAVLLGHSSKDGTFSFDDAVAKKAADDACEQSKLRPTHPNAADWTESDALAIACERWHGETAETIVGVLASICTQYVADVHDADPKHCPTWAKAIAEMPPPIRLE